jgi:transposase-like protein
MPTDIDGKPYELTREDKAQKIVWTKGQIKRYNESHYVVQSQSGNGAYVVISTETGWKCTCPDHTYRSVKCKHILAVEFSIDLRHEVQSYYKIISEVSANACRYCQSENIRKDGVRKNKYGNLQIFYCRDCKRNYTTNLGFEGMRATPQMITTAMQLYFSGESLRNVQKFLRLQGVNMSHVAVYKWIKKYVALMQDYLEKVTPRVSSTWRTDELFVKVRGNTKYMYALMDDQTRFWIAQQVADSKYVQDVRPMLQDAAAVAKKKPRVLISDGAQNFDVAWKKEYQNKKAVHIQHIHMSGDRNNNKMERLNGEIRDREKTMRGVKKVDSVALQGIQLYHNYFRPHQGLGDKTPAEIAGIKIQGKNKWITVIQNASKLTN